MKLAEEEGRFHSWRLSNSQKKFHWRNWKKEEEDQLEAIT